jgi:hypothetical protein
MIGIINKQRKEVMKYASSLALAGAVIGLTGCASAPREMVVTPVGPAPTDMFPDTGEGSLVVYSARAQAPMDINTEEWRWNNDFGRNEFLYEAAHSAYNIYTRDGKLLKRVANARGPNDDTPTVVTLPKGSYRVEAEAINCDENRVTVLMPVVVKPGQATLAHLEGGWAPEAEPGQAQLAKLPCGRPIGWRADEPGFATAH